MIKQHHDRSLYSYIILLECSAIGDDGHSISQVQEGSLFYCADFKLLSLTFKPISVLGYRTPEVRKGFEERNPRRKLREN